jgi:hypothetical protein
MEDLDGGGGDGTSTYPNMSEYRRVRRLAVFTKVLRDDSRDGHGHPDKAVLINTRPYDVEPCQAASWSAPRTPLSSTAPGKPVDWQNPRLCLDASEICLLIM